MAWQLGLMLFLMASGLTLVFGMMNFINLAHGSFYMIGAFIASSVLAWTGNFVLSLVVATAGAGIVGCCVRGWHVAQGVSAEPFDMF